MRLAKEVYQATEALPKHEIYGLTSQIRKAVFLCLPILLRDMGEIIVRNIFSFSVLQMEVSKN